MVREKRMGHMVDEGGEMEILLEVGGFDVDGSVDHHQGAHHCPEM